MSHSLLAPARRYAPHRLFLAQCLIFLAVGCGKPQEPKQADAPAPAQPEKPAPAQPAVRVVLYKANWCIPCRRFEPTYKALAAKYAGKAVFALVDIDSEGGKQESRGLGIKAVPSVVVFHHGKEVKRYTGAPAEADLASWLEVK